MRIPVNGNIPGHISTEIRNNSATLTIKAGSPVFSDYTGTKPGSDCLGCPDLIASSGPSFLGNAIADILPGAWSYGQLSGYMERARIVLNSRAATTDVYTTQPAIAIYDVLVPATGIVGVYGWKRSTAIPTDGRPWAIAAFTAATQASSATTTSDTTLSNEVATGKLYLRSL